MNSFAFICFVLVIFAASSGRSEPLNCGEIFKNHDQESRTSENRSLKFTLGPLNGWGAKEYALFDFLVTRFESEFHIKMASDFRRILEKVLSGNLTYSTLSKEDLEYFKSYFSQNHLTVPVLDRAAEKLLGRRLSQNQLVALRTARIIDRDERFYALTALNKSDSFYYNQKVNFLSLFDFSRSEIDNLESHGLISDGMMGDFRYSYVKTQLPEVVTPEIIHQVNLEIVAAAGRYKNRENGKDHRKRELTYDEANEIFEIVADHPVTRISALEQYDPDGRFGFCFGRAWAVRRVAERRKVHPNSIRKAFATGLMNGAFGISWESHVVTIIDRRGGGFWVLDHLLGRVVTLEKWYEHMHGISKDKRVRLFIAHPDRFGPEGMQVVDDSQLMDPSQYNGYFADMLRNPEVSGYD